MTASYTAELTAQQVFNTIVEFYIPMRLQGCGVITRNVIYS